MCRTLAVAAVALTAWNCCACRKGDPPLPPPISPATLPAAASRPAAAPADPAVDAIVLRMGFFPASLVQFQHQYMREEGYGRRGPRFRRLAGAIDVSRTQLAPGEYEVLTLLGPPDYRGVEFGGVGARFVYLYDRLGTKDWCAVVGFKPDGKLGSIEFLPARSAGLRDLKPFPAIYFLPDVAPDIDGARAGER